MADENNTSTAPMRSRDEIALELMKFVAVTTGYGKGAPAAGYTPKAIQSTEEYAEALLKLYQRCRAILAEGSAEGGLRGGQPL